MTIHPNTPVFTWTEHHRRYFRLDQGPLISRPIRRGRPVFSKVPHTSTYKVPNIALCMSFEDLSKVTQAFFESLASPPETEPFYALSVSNSAPMGWGASPLNASTVNEILAKFAAFDVEKRLLSTAVQEIPFPPPIFPTHSSTIPKLLASYQTAIASTLGVSMKVLKSNNKYMSEFPFNYANMPLSFTKKGDVGGGK